MKRHWAEGKRTNLYMPSRAILRERQQRRGRIANTFLFLGEGSPGLTCSKHIAAKHVAVSDMFEIGFDIIVLYQHSALSRDCVCRLAD